MTVAASRTVSLDGTGLRAHKVPSTEQTSSFLPAPTGERQTGRPRQHEGVRVRGDRDREEEEARNRDSPQLSSIGGWAGRLSRPGIWEEGVLGSGGRAGGKAGLAGQQQEDARWREGTQGRDGSGGASASGAWCGR